MDSGVIPGAFYIDVNTNLYKRQKGSLLQITSSNKNIPNILYTSYTGMRELWQMMKHIPTVKL
jgi:hypothetical protein